MNWLTGGIMIGAAVLFDLVIAGIGWLNFTVVGFVVVIAIAWIPSLLAFLTFGFWLAVKGEATLLKIALLLAPLASGCLGIPGWTATIWPLVAKTIAAQKLAVVPGLNKVTKLVK